MKGDRDRMVLATKYTRARNPAEPNASGNGRKHLMAAVQASLRRLQTDYIDLLWVRAYDGLTPVDETLRAQDDLIRQGKVNDIGISDTPAWIVSGANVMAELRGWSRFIGLQLEYSLCSVTPSATCSAWQSSTTWASWPGPRSRAVC